MSSVVESHPEYRALLQKVISSPDDNTPRLEMAAWLDQHDDPKRADFIRIQIELSKLAPCASDRKGVGSPGTCCDRCDLETRLFNVLVDEGRRFSANYNAELSLKIQDDLSSVSSGQVTSHLERGFVFKIEIKCEAFFVNTDELFNTHPITKVILKDRPPKELPGGSGKVIYFSDAANAKESNYSPLPQRLFARLSGGVTLSDHAIQFDSYQLAVDSLSAACVSYGRDVADGLLIG